tara:strand:+ start:1887 stop:2360 length:474 start_codon:yes stop_codon:yes gene_type:complete
MSIQERVGSIKSEKRKIFVERMIEHGDHIKAAKEAGYEKDDPQKFAVEANRLKRQLHDLILKGMKERFSSSAPKAAHVIETLMNSGESEAVRLKAAQDLLDRAGYQPTTRVEEVTEKKSVKELEAELIAVVGQEKAEVLLGKKVEEKKSSPEKRLLN